MMKLLFSIIVSTVICVNCSAQQTPDKIYGQLFKDVQLGGVFPDNKTFVDCTPKRKPLDIMYDYGLAKSSNLNLQKFVADNFTMPASPASYDNVKQEKDVAVHIKNLWAVLKREKDSKIEGSSLIPLPFPYIVPGGRFREIYYWDSYFTMQGLKVSGENEMIENMVKNFAYLIDTYGHIPNGSRTYYISRSQPPFFCMMVELLASIKGESIYKTYLPQMQKEYDYWMEGATKLKNGESFKRVLKLKNGVVLNRYWDEAETPRQESYKEDVQTADEAISQKMMTMKFGSEAQMNAFKTNEEKIIFRNIRAGACSGWDYSSRWFAETNKLATIQILDIAPVDLNALIYKMELILQNAYKITKQEVLRKKMSVAANTRYKTFSTVFFSKALKFYSDYNFIQNKTTDVPNAGAVYPLCFISEYPESMVNKGLQAKAFIQKYLLKDGGIVSTPNNTGQQWDAPNGWAPQQWMVITALENCKQSAFAKEIATRWINLNNAVYLRTGKLMEKYNVINTQLEAGGGEYPGQDGFGWTNGVLLAFIEKYDKEKKYLSKSTVVK
jgi:alpha,alpha-trehalase